MVKLKDAAYRAVAGTYIKSFRDGFSVFLAFSTSALVITLFMREHRHQLPSELYACNGKDGKGG